MAPAGFRSGDERSRPHADPAPQPPDNRLLEQVLQQTQSVAANEQPLAPDEFSALVGVARRHAGRSLSQEVATELVQVLFALRWRHLPGWEQQATAMSQQVAGSLLEHPASYDRLLRFWDRLHEAAQ